MTYEFYNNEEWKAFSTKMQAIRSDIESLQRKQRRNMVLVSDLDSVDDLLGEQMVGVESPSDKHAKHLLKTTGMDHEQWFWRFDRCKDAINELRVAKCLEVSSLQSQIHLLEHDYKVLDKEQDACRDRLIKEHNDAAKDQGLATASVN